ncbi:GNAT family N-acetyltransferase [Pseudomonas sichuanensis]|uniref:GNAT family N-acetyltransferase n=1 Tax=Pseudomonas sichuanensis TaxID=2213015 RepID=UPI000DA6517D|nr:GNAT family N-acetyltransferase [Pseudomonas sichuanensis]
MIRPATHEDIPRLVELGAVMHSTTCYSHQVYSPEKVHAFLGDLISGAGVIFAAEVGGQVVGAICGALTEQWFNGDLIAFEHCVFVEPSKRQGLIAMRMILAFQEWARIKGAKEVYMGVTTGPGSSRTARLYSRMGFKFNGPLMHLEIPQ